MREFKLELMVCQKCGIVSLRRPRSSCPSCGSRLRVNVGSVISQPSDGCKKIVNIYWEPESKEIVVVTED